MGVVHEDSHGRDDEEGKCPSEIVYKYESKISELS